MILANAKGNSLFNFFKNGFIFLFVFCFLILFQVAAAYFKDFHLLLIGVICLATSIEKWNLHKRVALKMVMLVGVNPAWYVLNNVLKDNNTYGKLCIPEIIAYCVFHSRNPFFYTQAK